MKNYLYIATITFFIGYPVKNQEGLPSLLLEKKTVKDTLYKEVFDHSGFHALLQKNVSPDGNVNYTVFKQDRTVLRMYLNALSRKTPTDSWSKQEKLAYWINAYNAMTIDLIIRNQPINSIKDIKNPWKQSLWKLGEAMYNLDEIEHNHEGKTTIQLIMSGHVDNPEISLDKIQLKEDIVNEIIEEGEEETGLISGVLTQHKELWTDPLQIFKD